MSFFDDQMDDWFENDCAGSPSDYYAGEIGPWADDVTSSSPELKTNKKAKKNARQRRKARALKKVEAKKNAGGAA